MAPHEIPVKRLRWPGFRDLASISFVKLRSDCKIKKRRPILGSWKYEHSISVTRTNFFQVCVRLPWKKASSAPLGTETGKGNHNFSNVVRALHLTLKWRENYLFPIYLFQLAVGRSCRIQNSFYLETKHRRPIIFPLCGHVYTSTFDRPSTNRLFWSTVYSDYSPQSVSLSMQAKKLPLVTEIHQDIWWQIYPRQFQRN